MTPRRRHQPRTQQPSVTPKPGVVVPAVLPQILLEAVNADMLVVTVNGDRLAATPIRRDEITGTVTELVARLGSATRVEVRELDGSVHADILTPPTPESRSPFAPPDDHAPAPVTVPSLLEFTADGFVPGEDVAVALILRHSSAGPTGTVRALIDRGEQPSIRGEVILLGRISGTTSVQQIG
ncbi:hypothetical protein [Brachybacterium tyrofermentans]|uniref:hypothetical protein n=1 Tax=Brachybacterium tyrofermentans TaxID=47848 RepID=UPI001867880E|nr:hypothetical protein [Brachybacterium tyrofermentans]